jgi:cytochrome o ubiquinol oxidase operon protein cyoD
MTKPVDKFEFEAGHEFPDAGGAAHGSVKSYLLGFILSVLLTAIPFILVMSHAAPAAMLIPAVIGVGVIQIVVHLVCFLHMSTHSSQLWNNAAFAFAVIIVGILVIGSLWIMYHLNMNMMPGMMPVE